jgi:hypothetical protein
MAKPKTVLDLPKNLLAYYLYYCGKEEIPREYHYWGLLSLVAALAADRITITRIIGQPMYLNLYTMIVGPSATGKSLAFNRIFQLAKRFPQATNSHSGRITAEALLDSLTENHRLFLGMPELSDGMRTGDLASRLIKLLTDMYSGSSRDFDERTRAQGMQKTVRNPCITYLCSTTLAWLYASIPAEELTSGFLGRFAPVFISKREDRLFKPIYPEDQETAGILIRAGLLKISKAKGEIPCTQAAENLAESWYYERPEPTSEGLASAHYRERELLYKLAGISALCEYALTANTPLVIQRRNMDFARQTVEYLQQAHQKLLQLGDPTNVSQRATNTIKDYVRDNGPVGYGEVVRHAVKAGILEVTAAQILGTLVTAGFIEVRNSRINGKLYYWRRISILPTPAEEPQDDSTQ